MEVGKIHTVPGCSYNLIKISKDSSEENFDLPGDLVVTSRITCIYCTREGKDNEKYVLNIALIGEIVKVYYDDNISLEKDYGRLKQIMCGRYSTWDAEVEGRDATRFASSR